MHRVIFVVAYFLTLLHAKPLTESPRTVSTTPPTNIPPRKQGCEYNGQIYAPGETFNEGTDGFNWCYGLLCLEDGSITSWDNFECGATTAPPRTTISPATTGLFTSTLPTTTTPKTSSQKTTLPTTTPPTTTPTTTTPPTTTPPTTTSATPSPRVPGCEYNGQFYAPGARFNEGTDGLNWCYGLLCFEDGSIASWDNFECGTMTTPPPTTIPPTTTVPSTVFTATKPKTNSLSTQPKTTPPTATPPTATPPTTSPLTTSPGCEYNGQFYSPGESFNEGTDGRNWCYGLLCQDDGSIISWDNFQCGTTTTPLSTTTPSTTTPSTTTTSTLTTVPGCEYEGQIYSPGQSFGEGKDDKGWCYGLYCDTHGRVVEWEDPFCETRTTSPTTFPPAPTSTPSLRNTFLSHIAATFPPVSTKAQSRITKLFKKTFTRTNAKVLPISRLLTTRSLSSRRRCFHEGKYYKNGDIVSRMYYGWNFCSGWICVNGRLESWSDFNCANPTTPSHHHSSTASTSKSPEEVSQCYHDGTFYKNNDIVILDPDLGSGGCNVHYCNNGVLAPWNAAECGGTAQRKFPPTDKPDAKASMSDTIPSPSSSQTLPTELADTPQPITTLKTTTIVEGPDATKPPTSSLCLYEGKFYEEGDIISSNFDDTKWCSGWYCKDGNILPWSCDNETSSATTVSATKEKDKPESVTTQTTLGPEPRRCLHEGKYYEESDFLPSDFDGEDWCTGLLCKEGEMVAWDNCVTGRIKLESTLPPATSPTLSTEDTTTKTSAPETELASEAALLLVATEVPGVTQKSTETTISPSITDTTTSITDIPQLTTTTTTSAAISASTTGFNPSTTAIPTTTDTTRSTLIATAPTTDIPTSTTDSVSSTDTPETITTPAPSTELEKIKCYYKGSLYPPGEITQGVFRDGRCFGIICDISGVIVQWVTKTCKPSVPPTLAMTATLPGCLYNDKYFPPGRLSHISDGSGWCLEVICKEDGRIISRSKRNCEKERIAATTTAKPKVSTADIKMCHYNGMKYYPGIINQGVGVNGWCYKVICQDNGKLYLWGDWNCATDAPMTTPPKPTTPPSTCFYNGKSYPAGEITKGKNASGWCYGVTCRPDGQVVLWGSFKCTQV